MAAFGQSIGEQLIMDTRNVASLREAKREVANFEHTYGMTSEIMLKCPEGDPRLLLIDGFELMDWHYALEQIEALSSIASTIHAVATEAQSLSCFKYPRRPLRVLVNSPERDLKLVA
jgi:hypothetical protein